MGNVMKTTRLVLLALLALPLLLAALTAGMPVRDRAPFALAVLVNNLKKLHTKRVRDSYPALFELEAVPVRIERQG
jgi:hypothetical protein